MGALLLRDILCCRIWRERRGSALCWLHDFVMIVGYPLRIVREFVEASFEPLILTHLVKALRRPYQFCIFDRFGAVLLSSEHEASLCVRGISLLTSFKSGFDRRAIPGAKVSNPFASVVEVR